MSRPSALDPRLVGAVLRGFRERAGLSQDALGAAAAIHRTHVGFLERGERNATLDSVDRVLGALGVTWAEFGHAIDGARAG
ncbi:MAG TPA: helix-turn-helix transcriptional regulator [Gemmatirosa sp.]